MIVGVPREIKTNENRVALVPAGAESLVGDGHTVLVEQGAGLGSGFGDETYSAAGATIVPKPDEVWAKAEMIMKVKEPIESEWPRMRKGQVIFTYFHFAASEPLTRAVGREQLRIQDQLGPVKTARHAQEFQRAEEVRMRIGGRGGALDVPSYRIVLHIRRVEEVQQVPVGRPRIRTEGTGPR